MKQSFILLLAAVLVFPAFAQTVHKSALPSSHMQVLHALLQPQTAETHSASRTTAGVSLERVVAQSTRDNTANTLNDSVALVYGIGRGSTYDYNTMIYPYNYPYNTSPMFNYAGVFTTPQILSDTERHWTVDPNTLSYGYYETNIAGYDYLRNTNSYISLHADSAIYPNMVYANNFLPGSHDISVGYSSNLILGVVDSAFKQYFKYNSYYQVTEDSTYELHLGVWRLVSKTLYTYDVSHNLTQIDNYSNTTDTSLLLPLVEQLQYINTYDASNRLLTVAANYHYTAGLSPYTRDTFAYTGFHPFHTAWREYQYDTINSYWAPMFNMTKALNVSGLPDTVNIQSFDSIMNAWVPQTMDVIHYNSSNDPDTLKDFEYNFTSWPSTPNFTTIYYYQTYLNTLGVQSVSTAGDVKVFPNPAYTTLTITGLDVPDNSPVVFSVLNMAGQLISREYRYGSGTAQISVSGLVPGMYGLLVQDAAGNMLYRQPFVKQ